MKLLFFR